MFGGSSSPMARGVPDPAVLRDVRSVPRAALGVMLAAGADLRSSASIDDALRGVSPPAKLAGMVLAGSVLSLLGVTMLYFRVPFSPASSSLSPDLAPLVTVLWVVGMANAVNLIDGLDGLAAGIVAIAAGPSSSTPSCSTTGCSRPRQHRPLIAVIVVGVCVGFLPWNFHPARIFMGDGGALLLGLLMASSTISSAGSRPSRSAARRSSSSHRCSSRS